MVSAICLSHDHIDYTTLSCDYITLSCDLTNPHVQLISKMSSLVGQVNVLRYFVPLLPSLATDTMFHVRKVMQEGI